MILTLIISRKRYKYDGEVETTKNHYKVFSKNAFIFYILFVLFSVSGLVNFPLISYHIKKIGIINEAHIPVLYLIAMGVDGVIAFFVGRLYDRVKFKILFIVPLFSIFLPFLSFSKSIIFVIICVLFYGIIIGCHETVLRAAIADVTSSEKRGFAYGLFNTVYGFGFLLGGWIIGFLYGKSLNFIYIYVVLSEIISLFFILTFILKKYGLEKSR